MKDLRKKLIKKVKRVVVKVGSAVAAGRGGRGGRAVYSRLASDISGLKNTGIDAVIVSSGAIALGIKRLAMNSMPVSIPERQAVAAVGQGRLMAHYDRAFSRLGLKTAQVLLTHDDFSNRKRFLNARNALLTLLKMGIVPVINENDTVAVDELKFGDNDELSALTTNLVEADLLVILTDIDGLYDSDPLANPDAEMISLVEDVDALPLDTLCGPAGSLGTGGMRSKCEAARKAAHFGAATIIAHGFTPKVLKKIFAFEDTGTLVLPREDRLKSRKHWLAFSTRPAGSLYVDDGAKEALLKNGRSLLPSGIKKIDGTFEAGSVVLCVDLSGMHFARGVVNYSSIELNRIKGFKTTEIETILGYKVYDEVIHRDNLVVL